MRVSARVIALCYLVVGFCLGVWTDRALNPLPDRAQVRFVMSHSVHMHVVVRPSRCLLAEDSAAHLRLIDYDPNHHRVVYTCAKGGY